MVLLRRTDHRRAALQQISDLPLPHTHTPQIHPYKTTQSPTNPHRTQTHTHMRYHANTDTHTHLSAERSVLLGEMWWSLCEGLTTDEPLSNRSAISLLLMPFFLPDPTTTVSKSISDTIFCVPAVFGNYIPEQKARKERARRCKWLCMYTCEMPRRHGLLRTNHTRIYTYTHTHTPTHTQQKQTRPQSRTHTSHPHPHSHTRARTHPYPPTPTPTPTHIHIRIPVPGEGPPAGEGEAARLP